MKWKATWPILPAQYNGRSPSSYIKCHKYNHERSVNSKHDPPKDKYADYASFIASAAIWLRSPFLLHVMQCQIPEEWQHHSQTNLCLEKTASHMTRL
jgi:hypothetical protein